MKKKVTLANRIKALEAKIEELEKKPAKEVHHHHSYSYPVYQWHPYYQQPYFGGYYCQNQELGQSYQGTSLGANCSNQMQTGLDDSMNQGLSLSNRLEGAQSLL